MYCCYLAEKAILRYCNWDINFESPSNFIDTIYNKLISKFKNDKLLIDKINKYKDMSITLLEFAICEYDLYSQYNQIILALSSCYISQDIDEEKLGCEKNTENIQKELREILDEIVSNINIDKSLIDSCSSSIKKNLEKDDDNEEKEIEQVENEKEEENSFDINYQLEITRSDSNLSFVDAIQSYNSENSDINLNEDGNKDKLISKYSFGRISPISNGEIISLNEEINDSLDFIELKNEDKNKNIHLNNNNNDKEIVLLKRKRN